MLLSTVNTIIIDTNIETNNNVDFRTENEPV